MISRRKLYEEHLAEKTKNVNHLIKKAGFLPFPNDVVPSHVDTGYRSRAKFKIFHSRGKAQVMATDPLLGEVRADEALWILPEWGRRLVKQVIDRIHGMASRFRVDGFEIQLSHGRPEAHLILSVKKDISEFFTPFVNLLLVEISELTGVAVPSQNIL